jgi:hypothetical protein
MLMNIRHFERHTSIHTASAKDTSHIGLRIYTYGLI